MLNLSEASISAWPKLPIASFTRSHLVTELGGEAHGRFDAGVGPHPDYDDFAHAVLLELKVEIGIGEAARHPMFLSDDLALSRLEVGVKTSAPGPVREYVALGGRRLDGRLGFPMAMRIPFAPSMMRRDEHLDGARADRREHLLHVLDDIQGLERFAAELIQLPAFRQKVVIGIDDEQARQFGLIG